VFLADAHTYGGAVAHANIYEHHRSALGDLAGTARVGRVRRRRSRFAATSVARASLGGQ
jgi:hypothetical protein